MEKICGVIDIQGFTLKTKFIPREFAVVSENFSFCTEIDSGYTSSDFSDEEKKILKRTKEEVNGLFILPFNDKNYCYLPDQNTIGDFIAKVYSMIATEEKPFIGVKNHQAKNILEAFNIPVFDLNETLPKYKDIQNQYGFNYICGYHKRSRIPGVVLLCAYKKASHLYRKIKDSLFVQNLNME